MKNLKEFQPIHIVGIGGIGMSAIAEVLHDRGIKVRGSDLKDGVNVRRLAAKGISVAIGHGVRISRAQGSSCCPPPSRRANPELIAARAAGLTVWSRADMLARMMENFRTVSVTGSHGKTTTTSMIAWIFQQAGLDPTVITGGIINDWGTNARIGKGKWFIVEADESDGTFVKLPTHIGVVTNIDPEHLDYYGSLEAMHDAFKLFLRRHPAGRAGRRRGRPSGGARFRRGGDALPGHEDAALWRGRRRRCAARGGALQWRLAACRRGAWRGRRRAARGRWPI